MKWKWAGVEYRMGKNDRDLRLSSSKPKWKVVTLERFFVELNFTMNCYEYVFVSVSMCVSVVEKCASTSRHRKASLSFIWNIRLFKQWRFHLPQLSRQTINDSVWCDSVFSRVAFAITLLRSTDEAIRCAKLPPFRSFFRSFFFCFCFLCANKTLKTMDWKFFILAANRVSVNDEHTAMDEENEANNNKNGGKKWKKDFYRMLK